MRGFKRGRIAPFYGEPPAGGGAKPLPFWGSIGGYYDTPLCVPCSKSLFCEGKTVTKPHGCRVYRLFEGFYFFLILVSEKQEIFGSKLPPLSACSAKVGSSSHCIDRLSTGLRLCSLYVDYICSIYGAYQGIKKPALPLQGGRISVIMAEVRGIGTTAHEYKRSRSMYSPYRLIIPCLRANIKSKTS